MKVKWTSRIFPFHCNLNRKNFVRRKTTIKTYHFVTGFVLWIHDCYILTLSLNFSNLPTIKKWKVSLLVLSRTKSFASFILWDVSFDWTVAFVTQIWLDERNYFGESPPNCSILGNGNVDFKNLLIESYFLHRLEFWS